MLSGLLPQWLASKFSSFFTPDTPSYRLDLQYWYHWNVQVHRYKSRLYKLHGSRDTVVFRGPITETQCCHFLKCMNQEQLYLKNHATYTNRTCTSTLVRIIEGATHSTFQRHPSASEAATTTNIRHAAAGSCSFPMVQKFCHKMLQRRNRKQCPEIHDS